MSEQKSKIQPVTITTPSVKEQRLPLALALVIVMMVTGLFTYLNRHYTSDDALIYYRYIANVLDGKGLVYNAGERFNGLTSPLYTYISIGAAALFGDVPVSQTVLAGVLFFLAAASLLFLRERWGALPMMCFAPLAVATSRYFYAVFGLETPLLLLLSVLALILFQRRRTVLLMVVASLLLLTRGESLLLLVVIAAAHFLQHRPLPSWKTWILPLGILAAHYAFNTLYFGAPIPGTLMAKIHQGESGLWELGRWGKHFIFLSVGYHYDSFFGGNVLVVASLSILAFIGAVSTRKEVTTRILLAFLLLYTSFYLALSIPNYHWYYAPYYFFGLYFAALGLDTLFVRLSGLASKPMRTLGTWTAGAVALWFLAAQATFSMRALPVAGGYGPYREMALWIKEHTPQHAKIAAIEIGHLGWYSDRYIIDILGLVSPPNAQLLGERRFDAWLEYYTPDYALAHYPMWRHEVSLQNLKDSGAYEVVQDFCFDGFVLLRPVSTKGTISLSAGSGSDSFR